MAHILFLGITVILKLNQLCHEKTNILSCDARKTKFCISKNTKAQISFAVTTLSNVGAGETGPTPVTTVLSLQNLMDANKFLVLFNVI